MDKSDLETIVKEYKSREIDKDYKYKVMTDERDAWRSKANRRGTGQAILAILAVVFTILLMKH